MFPIDDQLVMLIDRLNSAVNVCHEAPENEDQGYPYATGYARSAMSDVADDLLTLSWCSSVLSYVHLTYTNSC